MGNMGPVILFKCYTQMLCGSNGSMSMITIFQYYMMLCAPKALLIKKKYLTLSCACSYFYLGIFSKFNVSFSKEFFFKPTQNRSVDHKKPLILGPTMATMNNNKPLTGHCDCEVPIQYCTGPLILNNLKNI